MPSQLAPNVWILTHSSIHHNNPHMPRRNSTVHWSKETHPYITSTHSLQCYITKFSPTPMIWRTTLRSKYIFGYSEPKHDIYIIYKFPHMATLGEAPERELQHLASIPSIPLGQLYCHMAKGIQHIMPLSPEESTEDKDSIWTLFSHTGVYVMAIGLLIPAGLGIFCCYFFLVSTYQISMPTFTTRYHAVYNCGWWCQGSTHLQMWWQALTACKTSWESWPSYRVYTYMDRESM